MVGVVGHLHLQAVVDSAAHTRRTLLTKPGHQRLFVAVSGDYRGYHWAIIT